MRAEARNIGMRAVRRAAAQRALESLLIAERQAVAAALARKKPDLAAAAAVVVSKSSARGMPAATRAAARDITIEVMGEVDMAPFFRHASAYLHSTPGARDHVAFRDMLRCS